MLSFISAPENFPFAVALAVMLGIALLEGISTLFGAALSSLIDALLPEIQTPDVDLDTGSGGPDADGSPFALSRFLGWLRVGQVPILMLLVVFLTAFGLVGLGFQSLSNNIFGFLLPSWLISIPTIILSLPVVHVMGGFLSRYLPGDETEAVSVTSLIGRIATITIGTATTGRPAEARVSDAFGTNHLLMVEPDQPEDTFSAGDEVLLVKQEGLVFKVIANPSPVLID